MRNQLKGLSPAYRRGSNGLSGDRKALGGKKALDEVVNIVKPETISAWHRRLIARKFDGSKNKASQGSAKIEGELEVLIVCLAKENRSWGYDRIVGALANLGHRVSDQTVGNILKRHGVSPALGWEKKTTWKDFIRTHLDLLVAKDFFTADMWTPLGLTTDYVLFSYGSKLGKSM